MENRDPFKYFRTSSEIIRLAVMLYVRFPLSHGNVEELLHERSINVNHEAVRFWWHRFAPLFAAEIRKRRVEGGCSLSGPKFSGPLDCADLVQSQ